MRSYKKTVYETLGREPVHPFPARMAPGIALAAMKEKEKLRVLDPMMGSGTVLAVARAQGHRAVGIDIDPLAVLMARVWTTAIDHDETTDKAEEVLAKARERFRAVSDGEAYPMNADDETRAFARYWFDPHARRQLTALATSINLVRHVATRNALWCAFSRLIITKQAGACLAMDLSHSRPHKEFKTAPAKPFDNFTSAVERVVVNCISRGEGERGPATRVCQGDARKLPLEDASIDLVLTSPPYLNAIDYLRCSKFSLIWMGHTIAALRDLRAESVGTERGLAEAEAPDDIGAIVDDLNMRPKLKTRQEAIFRRYILDMRDAVSEVSRVLKPRGQAVYVVGENTVRGTFIRNSAVVEAVARSAGLRLVDKKGRALPANRRYLPPPGQSGPDLESRMRREVVLTFERAA